MCAVLLLTRWGATRRDRAAAEKQQQHHSKKRIEVVLNGTAPPPPHINKIIEPHMEGGGGVLRCNFEQFVCGKKKKDALFGSSLFCLVGGFVFFFFSFRRSIQDPSLPMIRINVDRRRV